MMVNKNKENRNRAAKESQKKQIRNLKIISVLNSIVIVTSIVIGYFILTPKTETDIDWVKVKGENGNVLFEVSKTPITNEQFLTFLKKYGQTTVKEDIVIGNDSIKKNLLIYNINKGDIERKSLFSRYEIQNDKANSPVTNVSYAGAILFCNEYGYELLSQEEYAIIKNKSDCISFIKGKKNSNGDSIFMHTHDNNWGFYVKK